MWTAIRCSGVDAVSSQARCREPGSRMHSTGQAATLQSLVGGPQARGLQPQENVCKVTYFKATAVNSRKDYHFEYTECDSSGSRWRVAIPNSAVDCSGLPDPVRGKECTFSCAAGEYLEMRNQVCSKCAEGSYSLGSGIKFEEWDELPAGFSTVATFLDTGLGPPGSRPDSCSNSSWIPRGNYIESNRDDCTVSLIYAVHLKKSGYVFFEYQYVDNNIFFEFFIQNDQCQEMDSTTDKWVKLTDSGEWGSHSVMLKPGTNILYWRTTGILMGTKAIKPVLVKNITIEGVAYTSKCFPCKPGTFSNKPGSFSCQPCPRNTYSEKGATECVRCDQDSQFSEEGASACVERPACTTKDYFQIHTPCNEEGKVSATLDPSVYARLPSLHGVRGRACKGQGLKLHQTQIMYKWIEPKICKEDLTNAIRLPPSGEKKDCPPCNPGFYNNGSSSCHPCPPGTYSDGTQECRPCPAGTEPALGFEYKWWNLLPGNMKTSCFNVGNSKCDGMNGWEVSGDHIQSGAGGSDNDYLILNLHIPGFKPPTSLTGATGSELGRITFVFEMLCSADCVLYFMVDINRKSTNVVESWGGTKEKQAYTHLIFKNATFTFTWAFQRTNQGQDNRRFVKDVVKIYSITATNAADGVASSCRACALGSEQSGSSCVPCPPGHYIQKETSQCQECPPDTHLSTHQVYGLEACIPCGPGSRSTQDHSVCYSDCFFYHEKENQSLHYDFSNLSSVGSLMNGPSFTSKGTKYFHFFNISLCGHEGKKMALCTNNISDFTVKETVLGSDDYANLVGAFVCQSTIIPSESKGFRAALSSQSIILADTFLAGLENQGVGARMELQASAPWPAAGLVFHSNTVLSRRPIRGCEDEVQPCEGRHGRDLAPQFGYLCCSLWAADLPLGPRPLGPALESARQPCTLRGWRSRQRKPEFPEMPKLSYHHQQVRGSTALTAGHRRTSCCLSQKLLREEPASRGVLAMGEKIPVHGTVPRALRLPWKVSEAPHCRRLNLQSEQSVGEKTYTALEAECEVMRQDCSHESISRCPAGTCDGCAFYFLWESAEACPLCTEQDFHGIEGACKRGLQETLYVWNEPKWCIKGISLPEKKLSTCETIDFWLKVGTGVGAFTAVLLVALTCYFWKKNQKLEYKYSKLVMTTNSKEGELPAADSCAIMEGEDNEEEVVYSNKQSLLGKLKSLATKEKEEHFESVQLKSSRPPSI
ncbi:UPF0577 protein KIAA1324-like protein [Heterocephalus glaber]|uniref:UPF0577 protein KIAA1324-like protein n=1 Tax=Heterocephalus glaber TaxID=10181 RepID=G5AJX0_HETGA|nr:UPF0577 protein KIAA1324-like protein [Heterocephalus glaber]